MRAALLSLVGCAITLKLLVWWLEPRMAFFPFRGVQETPSSVGLPYEDLRIPTADGQTLHGWWLAHPAPRAQLIYWHGNGGNLSLWLDVIVDLRQRGFSVLAADYRGYGASTGQPSEQGIYRDAEAVAAYFNERLRQPGLPLILWGRSLGCAAATHAASRTAVDGMILESPFPDVAALFARNPVMRFLSLFSSYRFATSRHLEGYHRPLLVVHGDADTVIPFRAGRQVFEAAPTGSKAFAVLRGVDHNDNYADNTAYRTAIDTFVSGLK